MGNKLIKGVNDLATINPKLAAEWHPTKNDNLTPQNVTGGTNKIVWWLLPYDDPQTGEHFDFEWKAYLSNRNRGNGCPYITTPKTIQLVQNLLQTKNIDFIGEKTFDNLKNKALLRFDLFINNKYLIEIDGKQHFKYVKYFFKSKNDFKNRIKLDNMKNQYCADNNIPILRIPYIYDHIVDKEKIEQFVLNFITTGKIPQEIIDFYSKYKFSNYVNCIKSNTLLETA